MSGATISATKNTANESAVIAAAASHCPACGGNMRSLSRRDDPAKAVRACMSCDNVEIGIPKPYRPTRIRKEITKAGIIG